MLPPDQLEADQPLQPLVDNPQQEGAGHPDPAGRQDIVQDLLVMVPEDQPKKDGQGQKTEDGGQKVFFLLGGFWFHESTSNNAFRTAGRRYGKTLSLQL